MWVMIKGLKHPVKDVEKPRVDDDEMFLSHVYGEIGWVATTTDRLVVLYPAGIMFTFAAARGAIPCKHMA